MAHGGLEVRVGERLQNGSRVFIIGGGPAGSFAALHLLKLARERGIDLDVMVCEPHDPFAPPGPRSCKGCAGILSAAAVRNMASLGLSIPPEVIQAELTSYVIHMQGQATTVTQPDGTRRIVSVYRGSGPRLHAGAPLASFDNYLLSQACVRGAQHIAERVRAVVWESGPVILTDAGRYTADLVVLATGVNSRHPLDDGFGYEPPESLPMVQDEVVRPASWPSDTVAGFFGCPPGLVFGAVVPKGRYLNVSLLWRGAAGDALERFYRSEGEAIGAGPESIESLCGCNPRIVVKPARTCFGDRWVAVGDAAISRLYKEGINSAFLTSGAAMRTALERGIGMDDFRAGYAPLCRRIAADNRYGDLLYRLCAYVVQRPLLTSAGMRRVQAEAAMAHERRIHARIMWGMLTGDDSYRDLFRMMLKPRGLLALGRELARALGDAPRRGDRP